MLTKVLCGFPQSLEVNSERVPPLAHDHFIPNPSQFTTRQSSAILSSLDIDGVVNPHRFQQNVVIYDA
jgi:hypothetical protein